MSKVDIVTSPRKRKYLVTAEVLVAAAHAVVEADSEAEARAVVDRYPCFDVSQGRIIDWTIVNTQIES